MSWPIGGRWHFGRLAPRSAWQVNAPLGDTDRGPSRPESGLQVAYRWRDRHDKRLRRTCVQHVLGSRPVRAPTHPGAEGGLGCCASAGGRRGGRPRVTSEDGRVQLAKKLHREKLLDIADICKTLRISRSTYYRYLGLRQPEVPEPSQESTGATSWAPAEDPSLSQASPDAHVYQSVVNCTESC